MLGGLSQETLMMLKSMQIGQENDRQQVDVPRIKFESAGSVPKKEVTR
jgi:hypothetical protein